MNYELSHLKALEAEIHIIREVAAEFERPVLLFSGGKDSIVMLRLAEKAFWPAKVPFPLMHIDTGHNFDEVYEYRDRRVAELGMVGRANAAQKNVRAAGVAMLFHAEVGHHGLQRRQVLHVGFVQVLL